MNNYLFHKGGIHEITLQDHLVYLRNPAVYYTPKIIICLLNSLFKKYAANEGISDHTDVFRAINTSKRKKIVRALGKVAEVRKAVSWLKS